MTRIIGMFRLTLIKFMVLGKQDQTGSGYLMRLADCSLRSCQLQDSYTLAVHNLKRR